VIYCVVPRPLEDELLERLREHYRDDPGVEVIVDRRDGPDRRQGRRSPGAERRRRRARGAFGPIEPVG